MTLNRWRWLGWLLSIVALVTVGLFWSELERIETGGIERIVFFAVAWVAMMGTVFCFPSLVKGVGSGTRTGRKNHGSILLIFFAAILVRLAFVGAPVSDDVNRYLWEGKVVAAGENPYATTADDPRWEGLRDEYWESMNHKDRLTAYPPGMELLMAAVGLLWYHPGIFKVLALVGDLWTLLVLILLARELGRPIRWLGFYAFNPVVLASFAAEAHFDSLMVAGIMTALYLARKGSFGRAWLFLGFAVQIKLMALVLVPFIWFAGGWKKSWVLALVLFLPSLFFWIELPNLAKGLLGFGGESAFNGGLYESLRLLGISEGFARGAGVSIFLGGMVYFVGGALVASWTERFRNCRLSLISDSFASLALLVVCSPIVHLWYLAWFVPFLALRPSLAWLVLCGAMGVTFLAWENATSGVGWGYSREIVVASWVPFFVLLLIENRWLGSRCYRKKWRFSFSGLGGEEAAVASGLERTKESSIDIVVPVYGEGPSLIAFLEKLKAASPEVSKIMVVDGHPERPDLKNARNCGVDAVESERGRGLQIATGIASTSANLVAIIHADTLPQVGWVTQLRRAEEAAPEASAFALGQRFDLGGLGLLCIEILNEARVTFNGSVFGDQTLVVRRAALEEAGGFPTQPLMEDVEVSWRLLALGPITYLGNEWTVSARKWRKGFTKRFWQVVGLMIRYRWVRLRGKDKAAVFSEKLYQEYYR